MYKKIIIVISLLVILLLDWTALDDITTGNEPALMGEYIVFVVSIPVLILLVFLYFNKKRKYINQNSKKL